MSVVDQPQDVDDAENGRSDENAGQGGMTVRTVQRALARGVIYALLVSFGVLIGIAWQGGAIGGAAAQDAAMSKGAPKRVIVRIDEGRPVFADADDEALRRQAAPDPPFEDVVEPPVMGEGGMLNAVGAMLGAHVSSWARKGVVTVLGAQK